MPADNELKLHQDWLGYCQQIGLVVSPSALHAAGVVPSLRTAKDRQDVLQAFCRRVESTSESGSRWQWSADPVLLFRDFLGWPLDYLAGAPGGPALPAVEAYLPDAQMTLRPTWAVAAGPAPEGETRPAWQMLIHWDEALDLDALPPEDSSWHASPQARFERLLRETGHPIGLLMGPREIRLVYAPRGETTGILPFSFQALCEVGGRLVLAAFLELLGRNRLFLLEPTRRLPALLEESRKHQAAVTVALAGQVLEALHELLRGFQAADDRSDGRLMRETLDETPEGVYGGLLTVILRLIFLLYAEERGLLYDTRKARGEVAEALSRHYSLLALYKRLRDDAGRYPDTMDSRYGAWAQLLAMFRLVFFGARLGGVELKDRKGDLFNPGRFPFLEGKAPGSGYAKGEALDVPMVPDGTVYRMLEKLLVLDGERLSYLSLDVEQIGSVYETMMGFRIERAQGISMGLVSPKKANGADPVIDLEVLLAKSRRERAKAFKAKTGLKLGRCKKGVETASSVDQLEQALSTLRSRFMPRRLPPGTLYLQPTEERRRTGSHYTPRSLTEPIVARTLDPLLRSLGENPTPEAILALKVVDPAMGSGAFLVAACRYLGDALVTARRKHGQVPKLAADEDEVVHARRAVAQNCLYGVDVNRFAVELAKLSLWLATLARDHAFTFVNHALKHGDSLVGLTTQELRGFHWKPNVQEHLFLSTLLARRLGEAADLRRKIEAALPDTPEGQLSLWHNEAEDALSDLRLVGDALIAAWFSKETDAAKEEARQVLFPLVQSWLEGGPGQAVREKSVNLKSRQPAIHSFHWPLEFPEVFLRSPGGFDAAVGNPPFAGKNTVAAGSAPFYPRWLQTLHTEAHGNADLVAHFFRRLQLLLRPGGCFGFIATNTLSQGDTRETGLTWLLGHGFELYWARKRQVWPTAATTVKTSVVHGIKGRWEWTRILNDREVPRISAYLFHAGGDSNPLPLLENAGKAFQGSIILGMGFTFDDSNPEQATPVAEMHRLITENPRNQEVIFPYIGGEEVNEDPEHKHHRYVINFGQKTLEEAGAWPDLLRIVEEKVRPVRETDNREVRRRYWWQFAERAPGLYSSISQLRRVMAISRVSSNFGITFLPTQMVYSEATVLFSSDDFGVFACLQSRIHEIWARFFSSTMKDDLRYTPSDCFLTFPFPQGYLENSNLVAVGKTYFDTRAQIMRSHGLGMTKLYNQFHDPVSTLGGIERLRELHQAMDQAVLRAYGYHDLAERAVPTFEQEFKDEEVGKRRKVKHRLRWPEALHDEVLIRLLDLNSERAKATGTAEIVPEEEVIENEDESEGDSEDSEDEKVPSRSILASPATNPTPKRRGRPPKATTVADLPLWQGDGPNTLL